MNAEELKSRIDEIIELAFERVQYAYNNNKETKPNENSEHKTRLVFPSYSNPNGKTRNSEQELRFCFVEAFNEYIVKEELPLYYSVETPTREKYNFSDQNNTKPDTDGRSGEFDLVVFELENGTMKRRCLIEFKANNASHYEHKKDFVKLNNEQAWCNRNEKEKDVLLRYFIELIDGYDKRTISSLKKKTKKIKKDTNFVCYSLKNGEDKRKNGEDISDKINQ